jgi:hypothetical protein
MSSYRDPCDRTGPAPRMWSGRYHKDHMRCIRAAKQIEAEGRNAQHVEAKAAAAEAVASAASQGQLPPPGLPGGKRQRRSTRKLES